SNSGFSRGVRKQGLCNQHCFHLTRSGQCWLPAAGSWGSRLIAPAPEKSCPETRMSAEPWLRCSIGLCQWASRRRRERHNRCRSRRASPCCAWLCQRCAPASKRIQCEDQSPCNTTFPDSTRNRSATPREGRPRRDWEESDPGWLANYALLSAEYRRHTEGQDSASDFAAA